MPRLGTRGLRGYGEVMRTLLALTALMLVLAGAVWWKTRPAEDASHLPPTTSSDERLGVVTVGLAEGQANPSEASFPTHPLNQPMSGEQEDANEEDARDSKPVNSSLELAPLKQPALPTTDSPSSPEEVLPAAALTYTVIAGDTFYSLVRRAYGTAPEALLDAVATANQLDDPSALEVGQVLKLPTIAGFKAPQKP